MKTLIDEVAEPIESPQKTIDNPTDKKSNTTYIVLLVLVIVIVIGIYIYVNSTKPKQ